jgi:medium-chain acyl-[acyl-carrier-protein] hydrolase
VTAGPLVEWEPPAAAGVLLLCLSHAGSGAYQFRPWQALLAPEAAVLAVQLPGRENRWRQEPATGMAAVLDDVVPAVLARLDRPYVVFGHSMGALVGYELARLLGQLHGRWPAGFVASASRAPDEQGGPSDTPHLTDGELVAELVRDGAVPELAATSGRLASLVVRPLRGDIAVCDSYLPPPARTRLSCPVEAWRGRDDTGVTDEHARHWREWTDGSFATRTFTGNHFYHLSAPRTVTAALREFAARGRRTT